jgi:hypothetical protein
LPHFGAGREHAHSESEPIPSGKERRKTGCAKRSRGSEQRTPELTVAEDAEHQSGEGWETTSCIELSARRFQTSAIAYARGARGFASPAPEAGVQVIHQ